MFTTTHEYCVTPTKHRPMIRLPERATAFMRDVKRRSLRVKRSKSLVINPPEKRKSGRTDNQVIRTIKITLPSSTSQKQMNLEIAFLYSSFDLN